MVISVGVCGRCVAGCGDVSGGVGDVGDVPGMCGNVGGGLVWALWGCKVWGGLEEGGGGWWEDENHDAENKRTRSMFHCCRIAMAQVVMHVAPNGFGTL